MHDSVGRHEARRRLVADAAASKLSHPPATGFAGLRARRRWLMRGLTRPGHVLRKTIVRVLWRHNVTWAEVISPRRDQMLIDARRECMWAVATNCTNLSFSQLGQIFNRDHSTVMHAVHKHTQMLLEGRVKPPKGVRPEKVRKHTPRRLWRCNVAEKHAEMIRLYKTGVSLEEIADFGEMYRDSARKMLVRHGVYLRPASPSKSLYHNEAE